MTHTNNKCVKGDGGVCKRGRRSYWTKNSTQLLRWMVSGPEIARLVNDFQADFNIVKRRHEVVENKRHHEQTNSVQRAFTK